jgi:hypothetical protein
MPRLVAGCLSYQRFDDPARATVSILAREQELSPHDAGYMTYIDSINRNYVIRVRCLNIDPKGTRIVFAGQVEATVVPDFENRWLLAAWENDDGVWKVSGNWTSEANANCRAAVPGGGPFTADAGSISILST